jgi:NTP pyrophosphatase (non-canonical NTP hydrolase)
MVGGLIMCIYYLGKEFDLSESEMVPDVDQEEMQKAFEEDLQNYINAGVQFIHYLNQEAGWWDDPVTGESLRENPYVIATKLMLVVSEVSEAVEAYRKGLNDEHLPHRLGIETELADAVIRIFDLCGVLNLDLGGAIMEKNRYNQVRKDHKVENRQKQGGKKF